MYHEKRIKRSIKTKVIFEVTIIIATILALTFSFILHNTVSYLKEKADLDLKTRTNYLANNIELRLEYLQESTELLASNELLINAFIDQKDKNKYLLSLIDNFRTGKDLSSVSLVDYDGRLIFKSDENTPSLKKSQELRLSLNLAQTVISLNQLRKEVVYIVPIKYYNSTQGAIVVRYNFKSIVDKYIKNEDFIYTRILSDSKEFYSNNNIPQNDYYRYIQTDNSAYNILNNIGITMEMGITKGVYLKPLYRQVLILTVFGLFILLLGALVSYVLAIKITNPILALFTKVQTNSAKNIQSKYKPLGTGDELDVLGYAFYNKEKELYDLNHNLQVRIDEATKELQKEKDRFTLAVDGSKDALWDWDLVTDGLFFGERFETMLGYDVGSLEQNINTFFSLLHPDDKTNIDKALNDYFLAKENDSYEVTFRLRMKDGSWKWVLGRGKAQYRDGQPIRLVGFNTDITEQKEYQEKLDHTAKHDSLTQLPNRFLLSELLTHAMHVAKRNHKQLALLFIDLDGFKDINDLYGHDAGDEVLSVVATRMNAIVRESDIVSRLGGDEFVIVITELDKNIEVIPLIQRLLNDIASNIKYNKNNMHVSASIGVSFYPQSIDIGNEALIRQADQAMYDAKTSGKNQYQFFNVEESEELRENQNNISSIRDAIKKNQFVLFYQPKVDMRNNKVVGLEALIRWNHPDKKLLYPDEFLPLMEQDANLMIELGNWVFENAFAQLESWHSQGLNIKLSINVSSYEIQQDGFSVYLKKLFNKYKTIKPNLVEIELLETAAFNNFELTSKTLLECQELGVSIAVDDFGTGYASLHYLKKLPMNTLKIDKSFVIDLLHTSSSISIVEASIGLAHAFGTDIVAEGIESQEHGEILLQLGCDIGQGYFISKAMPAEDVIDWIASYKGYCAWSEVKPMDDNARTTLYASVEHRSWINSIEDFVKNKNNELPQLDATKCYLGEWIKDNTLKYTKFSEFNQLRSLHNELHRFAEDELLFSKKDDKPIEIEKLRDLHQEIINKLTSLSNMV